MQTMGWNYWDYENCPNSVIDQIWAFMATEDKYIEVKRNEANG